MFRSLNSNVLAIQILLIYHGVTARSPNIYPNYEDYSQNAIYDYGQNAIYEDGRQNLAFCQLQLYTGKLSIIFVGLTG